MIYLYFFYLLNFSIFTTYCGYLWTSITFKLSFWGYVAFEDTSNN